MSRRRSTHQDQILQALLDQVAGIPFWRSPTGRIQTAGGLDPLGAVAVLWGLVPLVEWQSRAWGLHGHLEDLPGLKETIHALECSRANRWALAHHNELSLTKALAQTVHQASKAPGRTPEAANVRELIAQRLLVSQQPGHGEDR